MTNGARDLIQRGLRRLVIATVAIYLALAALGAFVWVQQVRIARESASTTTALCVLRADLEARIKNSQAFLKENPNGIPGISAKLIRDGIKNQQSTVSALSGLKCGSV
jgi:predicted PurR-regulated permease PerM